FCSESKQALSVRSPLKLATTIETFGYSLSVKQGATSNIFFTVKNESLGRRSRLVRPISQSSMSRPSLNHSSVKLQSSTQLSSQRKLSSICQRKISHLRASPSRIESIPNSPSTSGLESASICSRPR